ncbi:MAG: GHKL domain-containing protein [Proteobacteria bacterium]|nr:GHKL domain-containing protein [Pseudomonadota bacterium]MBU1640037.1 GHKL domain-containing protein [Pseudomonadota bacterium]
MRRRSSIRTQLMVMTLLLFCLLFPVINLLILRETASFRDRQLVHNIQFMEEGLASRGASLARSLGMSANQAIVGYDFTFLFDLLRQTLESDADMVYCFIMDAQRRVLAHPDEALLDTIVEGPSDLAAAKIGNRFPKERLKGDLPPILFQKEIMVADHGPVLEALVPVYNGDKLWGILRCGFSRQALEQEIVSIRADWADKMRRFSGHMLFLAAIFFVVGIVVVLAFTRPFVRAFEMLGASVNRISGGDLDHEIDQSQLSCTEFVDFAHSFNLMTDSLRDSRHQLDEYSRSLEGKVEERTKELREAQSSLLKQAHEAGMAEMAVGVLHNIGNAITPAKVGTSMLIKRLRESSLKNNLEQALTPLTAVVQEVVSLEEEERQRLVAILELLPKSINEEYEAVIDEISSIREKHEHIENIISLQMRYARVMGQPEAVEVNRVIGDALGMLNDSIRKRGIIIDLDLADNLPPVKVEKSKFLQIMVNLIKNSYEALGRIPGEKKITISSLFTDDQNPRVIISVKDNGCGFPQEEKERLFRFGYSSKKRGSGFGLHSCANYLIANQGTIEAFSDGPGQGAEFVVELPVESKKIKEDDDVL